MEKCVMFVDLEKAYGRVPRDVYWALRKKRTNGRLREMYRGSMTRVSALYGTTQVLEIAVGS